MERGVWRFEAQIKRCFRKTPRHPEARDPLRRASKDRHTRGQSLATLGQATYGSRRTLKRAPHHEGEFVAPTKLVAQIDKALRLTTSHPATNRARVFWRGGIGLLHRVVTVFGTAAHSSRSFDRRQSWRLLDATSCSAAPPSLLRACLHSVRQRRPFRCRKARSCCPAAMCCRSIL